MGIPHMVIFFGDSAFPYGDPRMEIGIPKWKSLPYGDFLVNPQMETNSIWKRVSDWKIPIWKWVPISIQGSPFPYGDCLTSIPVWKRGFPISIWGFMYPHFHMVIPVSIWGLLHLQPLYGNGDSPFPYGDW